MKLVDKLKNALFEEEYVEVEEKPKRKPIKKAPPKKEEKPIAKKVVLPERKEVKVTTHDEVEEEPIEEKELIEELSPKREFKFPMVNDNEFIKEPEEKQEVPKISIEESLINEVKEEQPYQKNKVKLYGIDEVPFKEPEYGAYEKKEERTYFKPSPIISPIYGILDKNYKKDEIIPKREIRLTGARENIDFDEIRRKAYGSNNDEEEITDIDIEENSNFRDQELVDLTPEESTPEVKHVTVGDAEEYFSDLGLEYNVDYKDTSIKKDKKEEIIEQEEIEQRYSEPVIVSEEPYEDQKPEENNNDIDDDNLFDLIDSMYDKD